MHLPLQQGLRLALIICFMDDAAVRVHLPLQQGLRRLLDLRPDFFLLVRVHLPLQQGLRHTSWVAVNPLRNLYECIFHYNKD